MTVFRVFALSLLACVPAAAATSGPLLAPAPMLLGLKVCLAGAALGAAVERLRAGPPSTRR